MPIKKCNKDKIENPITKRCVSKDGKIGMQLAAKKCSPKQVLNPKTKRCVSKSGKIGKALLMGKHKRNAPAKPKRSEPKRKSSPSKRKSCSPTQILNSATGRCVSKTGKIGIGLAAKKCSPSQIINPATGICVSRNGAIGKKLVREPRERRKADKPSEPIERRKADKPRERREPTEPSGVDYGIREIAQGALLTRLANPGIATKKLSLGLTTNCNLTLEKLHSTAAERKRALIGKGAEGAIYRVKDTGYVLKVSKEIDANFRVEAAVSKRLSDERFKHAPVVSDVWSCDGYGYILMEGLQPIGRNKKKNMKEIGEALDRLHEFNILFPDAHSGNFMRRSDGTVVIIDFGWAYHFQNRNQRAKNRHRDIYELTSFTWKQVLAWEMANLADAFGTAAEIRTAYSMFGQEWSSSRQA
jgi:tRNA A-37 threonylcarbamoyl transferase component Bud32